MDVGNGCTTLWMNSVPLTCILWKMDTVVKLYVRDILPQKYVLKDKIK